MHALGHLTLNQDVVRALQKRGLAAIYIITEAKVLLMMRLALRSEPIQVLRETAVLLLALLSHSISLYYLLQV